jgi:proteasome accessory factor C
MLTLIPWLLERPGASIDEIATAFGVPPRMIRSDLRHLDFCGLPGLGGGDLFEVTLVGDRVLVAMADELRRPLRLTPREALRLVLALSSVEQALGEELPALRSAIGKVRAAADLPREAAATLEMDGGGWIPAIRDALRRGRRVHLRYAGRADREPRDRDVDPWQLDVTPDGWYLHGHDAAVGGHRLFRLDRVVELEVRETPRATPPPSGSLPQVVYEPPPQAPRVELLLGAAGRWVAEAVRCEVDDETSDGRRIVFATDALPWVARLVLMAGPSVTVVGPSALRDLVRSQAAAALARYAAAAGQPD